MVVVGAAISLMACQQREAHVPAPAVAVVNHVAVARQAFERGEWAVAAPHLRTALARDPENLWLHYQLGICASWLDLRDEAIQEFRWVLAHAAPRSDEMLTARRWLSEAGVLTEAAAIESAAPTQYGADATGKSGVHGFITWGRAGESPVSQRRFKIHLVGLAGTPTKGLRYTVRTDADGRYKFQHVVAGPYRLTDAIAGRPKWRLKVALDPEQDVALDLAPENSVEVRDDFGEP